MWVLLPGLYCCSPYLWLSVVLKGRIRRDEKAADYEAAFFFCERPNHLSPVSLTTMEKRIRPMPVH